MADMISNFEMKIRYLKVGKAVALMRTRSNATVQS
jgi:hypothetical protein